MNAPFFSSTGSKVLDDLAEVIGRDKALDLAWEFRGQKLYIPKDPDREPGIARAIGKEAAEQLCEIFWRTTISLPYDLLMKRKVAELAATGMTKRNIARELHITEKKVYSLLGKVRDERQLNLL